MSCGTPWLRGTVDIGDGEVVLETNGEARMDRLSARVEAALPDARLVIEHRTSMRVAIDDWWRLDVPNEPHEPPADLGQAVGEFIREAERRWCDEPVPALRGRTPKQALEIPEGRADLEALLADMDRFPSGENGFDGNRLRELLGLDQLEP